jgi:hypothetical protein
MRRWPSDVWRRTREIPSRDDPGRDVV